MKKFVSLIIGLCFAVVAAFGSACGGEKPPAFDGWTPDNILQKPVTKDDVLISPFFWVPDSKAGWTAQDVVERFYYAGFNFMPLASNMSVKGVLTEEEKGSISRDLTSLNWWKKIDGMMSDYNMVYYFTQKAGHFNDYEAVVRRGDMFLQESLDDAKEIIPQLNNCIGVFVGDEPAEALWEEYILWARRYATQIKKGNEVMDLEIYANHLPVANWSKWMSMGGGELGILSHDYYCMSVGYTDYAIFNQMNSMRKEANKYGTKLGCYIQGDKHWNFRMPNFDEIRWYFNTYIAFGFTEFKYYTYMMYNADGCSDSVISADGVILHPELHANLSVFHKQLRALGANINLVNLEAKEVYMTGDKRQSGVDALPANWVIDREGLDNKNLIYSLFVPREGEGSKYINIVNNDFDNGLNDVEFYLSDNTGITALELYNQKTGKFEQIDIINGVFTLSFEKSESKFLKVTGELFA